jgi:hypothetical protein
MIGGQLQLNVMPPALPIIDIDDENAAADVQHRRFWRVRRVAR